MNSNKVLTKEKDNKTFSLPYYGVRGSIKNITSDGDYLIVTRYGIAGTTGEKLPTPKRKKRQLQENIINDIRRYLEANNSKYLTSLSKQLKRYIPKKKTIILASIATLITGLSILGTVLTSGNISYMFLTIFFVSFIANCHEFSELKEIIQEEKRQKFIHQYKDYSNKLNSYNLKREKEKNRSNTKYTSVSKNISDKIIDINKKKILEKNKQ